MGRAYQILRLRGRAVIQIRFQKSKSDLKKRFGFSFFDSKLNHDFDFRFHFQYPIWLRLSVLCPIWVVVYAHTYAIIFAVQYIMYNVAV